MTAYLTSFVRAAFGVGAFSISGKRCYLIDVCFLRSATFTESVDT